MTHSGFIRWFIQPERRINASHKPRPILETLLSLVDRNSLGVFSGRAYFTFSIIIWYDNSKCDSLYPKAQRVYSQPQRAVGPDQRSVSGSHQRQTSCGEATGVAELWVESLALGRGPRRRTYRHCRPSCRKTARLNRVLTNESDGKTQCVVGNSIRWTLEIQCTNTKWDEWCQK